MSPKKEDQQLVPDTNQNIETLLELRGFLGINNVEDYEEEGVENRDEMKYNCEGHEILGWDFTSSSWEVDQVFPKEQEIMDGCLNNICDETSVKEEEVDNSNNVVEETKASLNLNLNYEEVLEVWSNRPSLWSYHHHHYPYVSTSNNPYMGEVPNIEEEKRRRETSVVRYKEKRQNRLFSKKIRYQVRKQNADNRPRFKEWLGFLSSEPLPPANIRFAAVPQVIPSELGRAADFPGFIEAVLTKLEDPFERLLDRLQPPATAIIYDSYLYWAVGVGNRRNIPVAAFFTMSASFTTVFVHFDLLVQHGHFPLDVSERGNDVVDYIPGLAPSTIADMPTFFHGTGKKTYHRVLESISALKNAQYALFSSIYEFEGQVLDCLKAKLGIPVYHIGPMIPYFNLEPKNTIGQAFSNGDDSSYFRWLYSQPKDSVLYISQGSFLSVSTAQTTEFAEGIKESGVRFLWVTRGDSSLFKDGIGETGLLVPWCDQLKVLCHPSVGGFWTHCGWNSTCEGIYAGVPMLTCPLFWDQVPNSKVIVNDMKIGWRVMKNGVMPEKVITRQQVAVLVSKFMDPECDERKEMVERAKKLSDTFRSAVAEGGSAASDLVSFINTV